MADRRRVAVVGAGIGAAHVRDYLALPERFEVAVLCDRDTERARVVVGDAVPVAGDLDAVLADPGIDIVDICLPPDLHYEAVIRALEAGKHAVCEKPLVPSLRDADGLIDKAGKTGRKVFPVFQYRYGKSASQLRALRDANLTGRAFVGTLETHWNRGAAYYEVDWRGTWKGERGGAVLGHAIHIHDWLSFALGPVASVHAETTTRVNEIEVEDCAALAIRMESGAVVTSSVTLGAADDTSRLRLCFEGLTAESGTAPYAPAEDTWSFKARAPYEQPAIDDVLAGVDDPPAGYVGLFAAMADALDGDPGREVTLEDGRRSIEFVTAVYASARSGTPEALPLGRDHPLYDGWLP